MIMTLKAIDCSEKKIGGGGYFDLQINNNNLLIIQSS